MHCNCNGEYNSIALGISHNTMHSIYQFLRKICSLEHAGLKQSMTLLLQTSRIKLSQYNGRESVTNFPESKRPIIAFFIANVIKNPGQFVTEWPLVINFPGNIQQKSTRTHCITLQQLLIQDLTKLRANVYIQVRF